MLLLYQARTVWQHCLYANTASEKCLAPSTSALVQLLTLIWSSTNVIGSDDKLPSEFHWWWSRATRPSRPQLQYKIPLQSIEMILSSQKQMFWFAAQSYKSDISEMWCHIGAHWQPWYCKHQQLRRLGISLVFTTTGQTTHFLDALGEIMAVIGCLKWCTGTINSSISLSRPQALQMQQRLILQPCISWPAGRHHWAETAWDSLGLNK